MGHSAYYSDLPSFGLAHGYLNNFVKPALNNVASGATVAKGDASRSFATAAFVIAYARGQIPQRDDVNRLYERLGLVEARIVARDGRSIAVRTLPDFLDRETLFIVDVPPNLVPSRHAINKIEDLWVQQAAPGGDYRARLEAREIANFFRYLDILREEEKIPPEQMRLLPVDTLDGLTLQAIEARTA